MAVFIQRSLQAALVEILNLNKSILLLGPRQVGKTTLLKQIKIDCYHTFADPTARQEVERGLQTLKLKIQNLSQSLGRPALIVIDEVQKVPEIMDLIQFLIDEKIAQFILTGSSARKLKRPGKINLLPGRVIVFHMTPLSITELEKEASNSDLPIDSSLDLNTLLLYGSMPEVYLTNSDDLKEQLLQSYVMTYLEEEIRSEAIVRNIGHFSQFLELAAIESGNTLNLSKISNDVGVAHTTIANFYQILEDCFIVSKIEAYLGNSTRRLLKSPKYLFFDMGIKRICARESLQPSRERFGRLFEQFIGLELIRLKNILSPSTQIKYWRSYDGIEVDWIIQTREEIIPVEAKMSPLPTLKDARHLETFLKEYPIAAHKGYIICQSEFAFDLSDTVKAVPWQQLHVLFSGAES